MHKRTLAHWSNPAACDTYSPWKSGISEPIEVTGTPARSGGGRGKDDPLVRDVTSPALPASGSSGAGCGGEMERRSLRRLVRPALIVFLVFLGTACATHAPQDYLHNLA